MSPLERAARAVRDEIAYPHGDGTFVVEGGFRDDAFFREVACAVLEAIREPSEAMLKAASCGPGKPSYTVSSGLWVRMIDALSDKGA